MWSSWNATSKLCFPNTSIFDGVHREAFTMNLPEYSSIRIRKSQPTSKGSPKGKYIKYEVLDILRQRFVALTPEEWVRQHFINFLITEKGYPSALLANEVELTVGDKHLRCDSVLFDSSLKPRMIMEYKAESIPITNKVLTQIATYNMLLHVSYLIVSNGNIHYCLHYNTDSSKWEYLPDIPNYNAL